MTNAQFYAIMVPAVLSAIGLIISAIALWRNGQEMVVRNQLLLEERRTALIDRANHAYSEVTELHIRASEITDISEQVLKGVADLHQKVEQVRGTIIEKIDTLDIWSIAEYERLLISAETNRKGVLRSFKT